MQVIDLPTLSVPLTDFHLGNGRSIALIKAGGMDFAHEHPMLANLCLSECFDSTEGRAGGVISFSEAFSPIGQAEIMSNPFKLLSCIAVRGEDRQAPVSSLEWEGLAKVCADRKLRTKKGKLVDPRDLDSTHGTFVMASSSETIRSKAELHSEHGYRIGSICFEGSYRPGSSGLDDAILIGRVLNVFCMMADPDGIVVDLSCLDYQHGNDLHVDTYKFRGARSPIVVLAKSDQLSAYRGAGINCIELDMSAAMETVVQRAGEWMRERTMS